MEFLEESKKNMTEAEWQVLVSAFYDRTKLERAEYATKPHTVGTWAESVQVENEK